MRARLAAHTLHAKVDSSEHTKPARKAFLERFENEVDPDRTLLKEERLRRAEQAKKAYFTRLALKSAQARRRDRGLESTREPGFVPGHRTRWEVS